ncbi:HigA family addiction module antitoxin [Bosea sp. PAMC 26642]|uniref:HigA family addiction module antitoxin n=1 Tax=Bosea sp. (strain PAMC 26642) TaxID=1792307 RepID=UPI000770239B|nr:HigA family addiction module antitoxin [Bosea sp. PAMC 26642]AMJ61828.1 XRE family transcriptional regulator [Bosea sp. PAMC 26642]
MTKLSPVHPGEILREEFLAPLDLSSGSVARAIGVPRTRIERLAQEQVDLSPDTAIRLARFFGTSAEFWMAIQSRYALERATDRLGDNLLQIEPMRQAS